jgi:hypothetical protein
MLRKKFSSGLKRAVMVGAVLLLALMLAAGPQGTTFACGEGGPGLCPCPGCG